MLRFAQAVLDSVDWLVLGYHAAVHGLHIVLVSLATVQLARRLRRRSPAAPDELLTDPLTPGVSILLPTHNAAEAVVDRAHALLAQRYPDIELIIVDDGSPTTRSPGWPKRSTSPRSRTRWPTRSRWAAR